MLLCSRDSFKYHKNTKSLFTCWSVRVFLNIVFGNIFITFVVLEIIFLNTTNIFLYVAIAFVNRVLITAYSVFSLLFIILFF